MRVFQTIVAASLVLAATIVFWPGPAPRPAMAQTQAPPSVAERMQVAEAQAPQTQAQPKPAQIDKNGVLILIRSSLIALQNANETGNYTVLRDLGAPGFQQANTAVRLGEIFANLRAQRLDLSGVAALEPQLTMLPQIEGNGLMHMAGFFPSVPTQINFELLYAPVDGRWRLFGISVKLASSSPAAPSPPPAAASAAPPPKPEPVKPRRRSSSRKKTDTSE